MINNGESANSIRTKLNNMESVVNSKLNTSSYITFCNDTNQDNIAVALGKNNDSYLTNMGLQLAMYAWYKGDMGTFTYLKEKYKFSDIIKPDKDNKYHSGIEIMNSDSLYNFINSNDYSKSILSTLIPVHGTELVKSFLFSGYQVLNTNSTKTLKNSTLKGKYTLNFYIRNRELSNKSKFSITFNGSVVNNTNVDFYIGRLVSIDVILTGNDTIIITNTGNYNNVVVLDCYISTYYPNQFINFIPNAGVQYPLQAININGFDSYDETFVVNASGTYNIKVTLCPAGRYNNGSIMKLILKKGSTILGTFTSDNNDESKFHQVITNTISLNKGDIITASVTANINLLTDAMIYLSTSNTFNYPSYQ